MIQVLQDLRTGEIVCEDVPSPLCQPGHLLIQSSCSLISAGSERMMLEFGKANFLEKARKRPEDVRGVLNKIRTDGLVPTLQAVASRLAEPMPMGYSNVGVVREIGSDVEGFRIGERVVSNGHHAEWVCVPKHLCAKIPGGVENEDAAFTVLGAIALHGVRLIQPTLGESVAVVGLGLIGQLAVQILVAHGCRVLGLDIKSERVALAKQYGIEAVCLSDKEEIVQAARTFAGGEGVDAVLIAASTDSNDPIETSAKMCRKRGRIVLVGVAGLHLSRPEFYQKELTFQVSCSYGPGRYDQGYEEEGRDYPIAYVRWTEQRNFQTVLNLLASGSLRGKHLVSHRFAIKDAADAYRLILSQGDCLGVLLEYPKQSIPSPRIVEIRKPVSIPQKSKGVVGYIGAGMFSSQVLLPALKSTPARLKGIASLHGTSAKVCATRFGFEYATSDYRRLLEDPDIDTIFIATRHDSHARLSAEALKFGKHVFVEKPLAIKPEDLEMIREVFGEVGGKLHFMVGFNRRFSPFIQKAKSLLAQRGYPLSINIVVNAGAIPADHWVHDPQIGGGRIVGEGCHFLDLIQFLAGALVMRVVATPLDGRTRSVDFSESMSIGVNCADGSIGHLGYYANGHRSYMKERIEIFGGGKTIVIDNFRKMVGYGFTHAVQFRRWSQNKGHREEVASFIAGVQRGSLIPVPFEDVYNVTLASFAAMQSAETGGAVEVSQGGSWTADPVVF